MAEEEVPMSPHEVKDVGLVDAHAYSLLKAIEISIFGKGTV